MLRVFPFMAIVVASYLGLVFSGVQLDAPILGLTLISGAQWSMSVSDTLIAFGLALLFVEMVGATSSRATSIVNHGLSMLVFIACVVAFLVVPECGTSTFFIITLLTLVDVVAGYSVTIMVARRDFAIGDHLR